MSTDELQSFAPPTDPTYGNWNKKPRGGLWNLGTAGTAMAFIGIILVLLVFMFVGWVPAAVTLFICAFTVGLLVARDKHNRSHLMRVRTIYKYFTAKHSGSNTFRSGPLTPQSTNKLPGILGTITSNEFRDAAGREFVMLSYKAGYHTVVLKAFPDGSTNADKDEINHSVAKFGNWLATHGERVGLIGASVTVETAPDTGHRLRRENTNRVVEWAPKLAKDVISEILDTYPVGSADVSCWITLSFSERGRITKPRGEADRIQKMAASLSIELPDIVLGLAGSGAGAVRPMDVQSLCEVVRVAYDPAAAAAVEEARAANVSVEALNWNSAGPVAYETGWDFLQHDSGVSITSVMTLPPRQVVHSDILKRLLSPSPNVLRKRVTIHYRPLTIEEASTAVERDHTNAIFALNSTKKKTARLQRDVRIAQQTADEEAAGAGMDDFAIVATMTVGSIEDLPDARNAMRTQGTVTKLQLRPCYGYPDSAFGFTLPVGFQPERHIPLPKIVKRVMG